MSDVSDDITTLMSKYVYKNRFISAVVIDDEWYKFLTEKGYGSFNKGDYYLKQVDGQFVILEKENFERLFEPHCVLTTGSTL